MEKALPPHLAQGASGEETAAAVLAGQGYNVLARNWRAGRYEIDLICEKDGEIIFIEVKTRRSHAKGGGPGAITAKKRHNLVIAAKRWLCRHDSWLRPCRFDVVCLYGTGAAFSLEHYKNAFIPTLDSRDAHWQSW